jgi:hypothetical protein
MQLNTAFYIKIREQEIVIIKFIYKQFISQQNKTEHNKLTYINLTILILAIRYGKQKIISHIILLITEIDSIF